MAVAAPLPPAAAGKVLLHTTQWQQLTTAGHDAALLLCTVLGLFACIEENVAFYAFCDLLHMVIATDDGLRYCHVE